MRPVYRAFALALALTPAVASAQAHVINCPGVSGFAGFGGLTCDGFALSGGGTLTSGLLTTAADEHGAAISSPTDFTLLSATFQSLLADPNQVYVYGYSRAVVDGYLSGFPYPGSAGPYSYFAAFTVGAGFPTVHTFNWANVAGVKFDGSGGRVPNDPGPSTATFPYTVSKITVLSTTVTPEPATLVLFATGLFGAVGLVRRRQGA